MVRTAATPLPRHPITTSTSIKGKGSTPPQQLHLQRMLAEEETLLQRPRTPLQQLLQPSPRRLPHLLTLILITLHIYLFSTSHLLEQVLVEEEEEEEEVFRLLTLR